MKLPKNKKNDKLAIARRRKQVAELYLQGFTYQQIADQIKTYSYKTVETDIKWIHEQWLASTLVDMDDRKRLELQRIDNLEKTAWEAWAKSCEKAEFERKRKEFIRKEIKEKDKRGKETTLHKIIPYKIQTETTSRGQSGDPRFLDQVHKCIELRLKVLGLLSPDVKNIQNNFLKVNWNEFYNETDQVTTITGDPIESRIQEQLAKPISSELAIPQAAKPLENLNDEFSQKEDEPIEVG